MNVIRKLKLNSRSGAVGAAFTVAVGVVLLLTPIGQGLEHLSYDSQFLVRPGVKPEDLERVVIIYMDERSFQELKQPNDKKWDRALHARLVDWLRTEQCKLIVFDVFLSEPGSEEANKELAQAIKSHRQVVLAALLDRVVRPAVSGKPVLLPRPEFLEP